MKLRDRILHLAPAIRSAALASGARDVRLFGSVARGEDAAASDVDFLVSLEPGRTLLDLARLELALEALLGRRVEVRSESELPEYVLASARHEAVRV